ncbi:MAG: DUF5688 family protein [Clostridiales bacterium]|jgi:hypothetical protein|nr:DUF5688 family protein [Clostridiales bacterium]
MEKRLSFEQFTERMIKSLNSVFEGIFVAGAAASGKCEGEAAVEVRKLYPDAPGLESKASCVFRIRPEEEYAVYFSGLPFGDVMFRIIKRIEEAMDDETISFNRSVIKNLASYEKIKDRLFVRMLPYERNSQLLRNHVFRQIGDMALVLCVRMQGLEEASASFKVPLDAAELWGFSPGDAIDGALAAGIKSFPPRLAAKEQYAIHAPELFKGEKFDFMSKIGSYHLQKSYRNAYVLTNSTMINGAAAIFYPGVAKRIRQLLKDDFYIIPVSIHEVVLHPLRTISRDFAHHLAEGAKDNPYLRPEDYLSARAYKYAILEDSIREI